MKTEISSSWVGHLASKQTHVHVSSNIPLPNVTAETRLLRSGLTTDELLDAKKRKKKSSMNPSYKFEPILICK